ncbi:MAG: hypothetical protein AABX71_02630 [Nanoarchaeota archaeon]
MTYKIPKIFAGKPIEGAMERALAGLEKTSKPKAKSHSKNSDAVISSIADCWQIQGVNYRNNIIRVDLAKQLLDSGKAKTQDRWAEYRNIAEPKGDFYTGDMPLYHAVFTALFNQKDKSESEEAKQFIQKSMREKWLMTLTRPAYQPKGKDKIIHNYNTNDFYPLEETIVGPDRKIAKADSLALKNILGTGNIKEIKDIYKWLNDTDTYLYRLNSKPSKVDERVAWFGAGSGRLGLYCDRYPDFSISSLGVRVVREAHAQKI